MGLALNIQGKDEDWNFSNLLANFQFDSKIYRIALLQRCMEPEISTLQQTEGAAQ